MQCYISVIDGGKLAESHRLAGSQLTYLTARNLLRQLPVKSSASSELFPLLYSGELAEATYQVIRYRGVFSFLT